MNAGDRAFLAGLNLCFPGWGGEKMFDWCFRRRAGGPAADRLVAARGDRLVAGSAVTYRRAGGRGGDGETIACMTASWTLPEARGQGLFRDMIARSRAAAAARGCRLLVAFAASDRASGRGLAAAADEILPAAYLTGPGSIAAAPAREVEFEPAHADPFVGPAAAIAGRRLEYSREEWIGQFVARPAGTRILELAGGALAVLERGPARDRLLATSPGTPEGLAAGAAQAAAFSQAGGRGLSVWTMDGEAIGPLEALGFTAQAGAVYLMSTGLGRVDAGWRFVNGDRM